MRVEAAHSSPWLSYAITGGVLLLVLALRVRKVNKAQPLRIERLWIVPDIYAAVAAVLFAEAPPEGAGWLYCLLALAAGSALGWQRGRLMRIAVDPETHAVSGTQSPAAMIFIIALLAVRMAMRSALAGGGASGFHLTTATVTDILVALALGFLSVQRLEMYLRARRLLGAARAL